MNKKGILLFDIDRTIFDTAGYSNLIEPEIARVIKKVSREEIKNAKNEFISSLSADREFDPENLIKFLCQKFSFEDKQSLLDVFYDSKYKHWYSDLIFPETFEVIEKLKSKFSFGVYSEGTKKFQNYKFESMGISNLMGKSLIFILDHKTNPNALSKIPKGAVVVDDKESVCDYLTDNQIEAIWLNKKDDRLSDKFKTIHHLTELPPMLL
jgi:phosphoglycolate phosphatase-like HAD superfamily hydrolase